MKRVILSLFILLSVVTISSCGLQAHIQQSPGADLGSYKTFSWLPHAADSTGKKQYTNFEDAFLRETISEQLEKKGLREAKNNADILIDYDVQVENEQSTRSQPVYTQPFIGYRYNRFLGIIQQVYYPSRYLGTDHYQVPYKSGTITVNIVDKKTNAVTWQGWAETEVDKKQMNSEEMSTIVKAIFKKFKI